MTVKDIVQQTGLSPAAIYKRIKSAGLRMEQLKNKSTGQLTEDGEKTLRELFDLDNSTGPTVEKVDNHSTDDVEKLTTEVERLRSEVDALRSERDYLRAALERSQQLQAVTLAKMPTPPPAITSGEDHRGLRSWWRRIRGRADQ